MFFRRVNRPGVEGISPMYCPKCKKLRMKGEQCPECQSPLVGYEPTPPPPSNAVRLRQITLELRTGDLPLEKFVAYLDRQEAECEKVLRQVQDSRFDEDSRLEMAEELAVGRRGVHTYLQAIQSLRDWMRTRSDEDLKRSFALAEQGDNFVAQAVELNRATYRTHIETAREFLLQMGFSSEA